jgi:ankyrin repeat protein
MPKVKFPGFPRFLNRPSGSGPLSQPLLDQDESRSDNANRYPNTNRDIVFLHACNENDLDLAKQCLIEQPALVNIVDTNKMTPLHIASGKGHLEMVKLLIANKADVNKNANGITPIKLATNNGHLEIAKLLIENEASVNQVTEKGLTGLLHLACLGGDLGVVKKLINAKPALLDRVAALHLACRGGHLEVVKELINAKPDLLDRVTGPGLRASIIPCQFKS